jgi:NTP pyrophosphatase (non-canonical NTP hydrolase)
LAKELGDVVWYIAVMAHSLGLTLEDIMQGNVEKLKSRKQRGVIRGKGDNR